MKTVESVDGTEIAYDVAGSGPSLILVGGAFNTRMSPARLIPYLTDHFEVYSYDRRGRGDSGTSARTTPADEMNDLEAVIYAAGGSVNVFGHSSGAILALETAARGAGIARLAVYEPPFSKDDDPTMASDVLALLAVGDSDAAARRFLGSIGAPVDWLVTQPWWGGMASLAPTLPNEFALAAEEVPVERYATIDIPTLAIDGGASTAWAHQATVAVTEAITGARSLTLAGQDHNPSDELLGAALVEFFEEEG